MQRIFSVESLWKRSFYRCYGWNKSPHRAISISSAQHTNDSSSKSKDERSSLPRRGKSEAEVVIIGGGAVGVSIAYHLAKRGMKDVVLLEKSELTAGSTWHAAGLATYFHPSINPKKIHHYSLNLFKTLEEETGQNVGLHTPGSVRILSTPERVLEGQYQMSRQHWNAAEQYFISADKVLELVPLLNPQKVLAGIYNPNDGHIDPYSLTQALAIGARKYGAEIFQYTPVVGMKLRTDNRYDIITEHGTLISKHVVNAAGFWAKEVAQMLGVNIPIVPVHHQYVITGTISEVAARATELPVIRDLEGSYYLRQERQGLLFGPYEGVDRMQICDEWLKSGIPKGFGKELFQPNLERIMPHVEAAMEMVPVLQSAEIQTIVSGPITYNCENAPLLGPYWGLPHHWLAVGFGYGIIQCGGAGRYIADYIVDGEPPHELSDLDANRYGWWCTEDFAVKKARESYGLNNLIGHPKEERRAGRPTARCSPLYETMQNRGAEFGFHNGWEQPHWFARYPQELGYKPSFKRTNWFTAMQRECQLVKSKVGIIDLTPFSKYHLHGKDASTFLDYVTANSLPQTGFACISHMLTPKARVYSEITVNRLEDNAYLLVTGSGVELHDLWWLQHHAREGKFAVQFDNVTDKLAVLGVAGPLSRQLLQPITNVDLSTQAFPFLHCCKATVGGVAVTAIRISYSGELGWELYCQMEDVVKLYKALLLAGEGLGVDDFGTFALNSLRIEKGFRMWGNEMNKDTNPFESGLGFFVKVNKKSNFIGKSKAQELKRQELSRKVVHLVLHEGTDNVDPEGNETVWFQDKVIGNTTSGTYSTHFQAPLAMANLRTEFTHDNAEVEVELLGRRYPAKVLSQAPCKIQPMLEREAIKKA